MSKWNRAGVVPEYLREGKKDLTQLPVVVYGSLRHGQGNWVGRIKPFEHTMTPVTVDDHAMYPMSGFPFVVPQEGAVIVGELVEFPADVWENALMGLDNLEGYRGEGMSNLYDRVRVMANLADGTQVEAYMYVAHSMRSIRGLTHYVEGDWVKWRDTERMKKPTTPARYTSEVIQDASAATLTNGVGRTFLDESSMA